MERILHIPIVVFVLGASLFCRHNAIPNELFMPGEIDVWGGLEEEGFFDHPWWRSEGVDGRRPVSVDGFGAVGDGVTNDTQAFVDAWNKACSMKNAVFLVPEGGRYLVKAVRFNGPCADNLIIQISGTIVAPDEPKDWDPKLPRLWLSFSGLNGVKIQGGGTIDGSGTKWWASSCKINKTNALTIDKSSAVKIQDLTIQNSQQMHFTISRSDTVRVSNVLIASPANSPNTDGIHISGSTGVVLQNCNIGTGDDCVSIVSGSSNIKMKNIICGPGHGISIGSLGKGNSTDTVIGVVLDTATLTGTTNGLRIKTWQGGSGAVRSVRYENVVMNNVSNPIIIDQFYCDSSNPCKNLTSAVKISQVMYRNIQGTSKTSQAIKFACSDAVPCSNIVLNDVNLLLHDGTAATTTSCNCAVGFDYGFVQPSVECLRSTTTNSQCQQQASQNGDDDTMEDNERAYSAHTEL
ncbi:putative polygalacturonase [Acorus gramineus]|uniref:endo-polygalacturonase n=1 Tax=Acorus gramineus TaxID=55184 RepID=A0AAV9AWV7_ACOGR|nr:putative polygalacturonase [Acorus gramineus]